MEGNNGQIGVDLFKYVYSRLVAIESYDIPTYCFKDDELVTSISPKGTQFQILEFIKSPATDEVLLYRTYIDGWDTYFYLNINGTVWFMQL